MNAENTSLTRRLRLLGNQVMLLAGELSSGADQTDAGRGSSQVEEDSDLWLLAAQDLYRERRRRSEFFPDDLFGEPAWDTLLDLYIAEKKNERVCVTSACLGAQVPCATGLRWLRQLEQQGLVEREADKADGRRKFVRISERGYRMMTAYIATHRRDWLRDDVTRPLVRSARRSLAAQPSSLLA